MRKGFTLIELLIVVLIVGLVYTLAISNFDNIKQSKIKPNLLSLKENLKSIPKTHMAELICLDKCKSCSVYVDGVLDSNRSELYGEFLDEEVKAYRYDASFGLVSIKNKVFFNTEGTQEDICFSLSVDKNGVSEQLIVEYKNKFYDFSPYFKNTQIYTSGSELVDIKEYMSQEVLR